MFLGRSMVFDVMMTYILECVSGDVFDEIWTPWFWFSFVPSSPLVSPIVCESTFPQPANRESTLMSIIPRDNQVIVYLLYIQIIDIKYNGGVMITNYFLN